MGMNLAFSLPGDLGSAGAVPGRAGAPVSQVRISTVNFFFSCWGFPASSLTVCGEAKLRLTPRDSNSTSWESHPAKNITGCSSCSPVSGEKRKSHLICNAVNVLSLVNYEEHAVEVNMLIFGVGG